MAIFRRYRPVLAPVLLAVGTLAVLPPTFGSIPSVRGTGPNRRIFS